MLDSAPPDHFNRHMGKAISPRGVMLKYRVRSKDAACLQ
jgi:hypothetical protein